MMKEKCFLLLVCWFLLLQLVGAAEDVDKRIEQAKMELWVRGAFALDETTLFGDDRDVQLEHLESLRSVAPFRLGPIRKVRQSFLEEEETCDGGLACLFELRGGAASTYNQQINERIEQLGQELGPDFLEAIEKNKKEHAEDCEQSCENYYCAPPNAPLSSLEDLMESGNTTVQSYSMGAVPPEDFASDFGFPLDLIKVTHGKPLFSRQEAAEVILNAEAEGVDKNEYKSGKYRLGGDWLTNLPNTRAWFNKRLESTFFPLLAHLFPEVVSSPSVLRAHSVSLLKYNSSHPRTDVHVDNGILAMTLAMTPQEQYVGGGTFFEHFDTVLPMDVGHGTFRPGSVRHGGQRVSDGTRYILGAFLLIEDRVEHVRRLKNRGSKIRPTGDLEGAAKHFQWALALNPKCTTCLKDWAEILHTQKDFDQAETKIRKALELLEEKDSDAFFTLGMLLSEQGKDQESIETYKKGLELNDEDAEMLYNLGTKLGEMGDTKEEMKMYARATQMDPTLGGPWLNWGTALAQSGNLDDAEIMFEKALGCGPAVAPKAMMNLSILYKTKAEKLAQGGDLEGAKAAAIQSKDYVDRAQPALQGMAAGEAAQYLAQVKPLQMSCHRMIGSVCAGMGDLAGAEAEFRVATKSYPNEKMAWQMLWKVLDLQGKKEEAQEILAKMQSFA